MLRYISNPPSMLFLKQLQFLGRRMIVYYLAHIRFSSSGSLGAFDTCGHFYNSNRNDKFSFDVLVRLDILIVEYKQDHCMEPQRRTSFLVGPGGWKCEVTLRDLRLFEALRGQWAIEFKLVEDTKEFS